MVHVFPDVEENPIIMVDDIVILRVSMCGHGSRVHNQWLADCAVETERWHVGSSGIAVCAKYKGVDNMAVIFIVVRVWRSFVLSQELL